MDFKSQLNEALCVESSEAGWIIDSIKSRRIKHRDQDEETESFISEKRHESAAMKSPGKLELLRN